MFAAYVEASIGSYCFIPARGINFAISGGMGTLLLNCLKRVIFYIFEVCDVGTVKRERANSPFNKPIIS